jgi:hypothetical protein
MNSRDVVGLYEAYSQIYEGKSDDNLTPLQKIRKRNQDPSLVSSAGGQTSERRSYHKAARGEKKAKGEKSAFGTMRHVGGPYNEEVDVYDLVLDYLLDEGYCDDVESAEVIMANMSEEWLNEAIESLHEISDQKVARLLKKREKANERVAWKYDGPSYKEYYKLYRTEKAVQRRNARTGSNVKVRDHV